LFDRVARVVCEADCLPRKELFESWEVARRTRRRFRGGRVVDLAAGHGLVGHLCQSALAFDVVSVKRIANMLKSAATPSRPETAGKVVQLPLPRFMRATEEFETLSSATTKEVK
jgi:hypothetical protein